MFAVVKTKLADYSSDRYHCESSTKHRLGDLNRSGQLLSRNAPDGLLCRRLEAAKLLFNDMFNSYQEYGIAVKVVAIAKIEFDTELVTSTDKPRLHLQMPLASVHFPVVNTTLMEHVTAQNRDDSDIISSTSSLSIKVRNDDTKSGVPVVQHDKMENLSLSSKDELKIMIVGDSMTHASEGDFTWRYRLWEWFRQAAPKTKVTFVGALMFSLSSLLLS